MLLAYIFAGIWRVAVVEGGPFSVPGRESYLAMPLRRKEGLERAIHGTQKPSTSRARIHQVGSIPGGDAGAASSRGSCSAIARRSGESGRATVVAGSFRSTPRPIGGGDGVLSFRTRYEPDSQGTPRGWNTPDETRD